MHENLRKLRELTDNLENMTRFYGHNAIYDDHTVGTRLYNDGEIAIQRAFMPKGTVLQEHVHHNIQEFLIVMNGELKVDMGDFIKIVNNSELAYIEADIPHIITALQDTYMIGITVPADGGYPK